MSTLPGLLLLHGVGDSGACWAPFVARLRAADHGRLAELVVSTPDAPAHGGATAVPGTLAAEDQLAVAIEHANALVGRTGGTIVVGGHSMGSAVALGLAAARPDLTRALWLEDTPLLSSLADNDAEPDEPVDISGFRPWFDESRSRELADLVADARADHPLWDPDEYEPWARAKQQVDGEAFDHPVHWIGAGWAQRARSITVPTVLVAGDPTRGGVVHPGAAQDLAALPGWSVHRLPTGHDVRRDAPDQVVRLLAALIESVAT